MTVFFTKLDKRLPHPGLLGPAGRPNLYIARKGKMVPKLWLLDWNSLFEVQRGAGFDMEANRKRVFGIGKNG